MATAPKGHCDLIMKGGITSGVVYPLTILELARHYNFKCIGGTSAGAIAAAFAAAFQRGRRIDEAAAEKRLAQCQQQLVQDGFLEELFRANKSVLPTFSLLKYAMKKRWVKFLWQLCGGPFCIGAGAGLLIGIFLLGFRPAAKWHYGLLFIAAVLVGAMIGLGLHQLLSRGLGRAIARARPLHYAGLDRARKLLYFFKGVWQWLIGPQFLLGLLCLLALSGLLAYFGTQPGGAQYLGIAVLMLVCALLSTFLWGVSKLVMGIGGLQHNNYGFVKGHREKDAQDTAPVLTDWICSCLDYIACRDLEDKGTAGPDYDTLDAKATRTPLTFAMLKEQAAGATDSAPAIELMMVTSNVCQKQAYTLPFNARECFIFNAEEMREYFPERVVTQMIAAAEKEAGSDRGMRTFKRKGQSSLTLRLLEHHYFVPGDELPVAVAVRMSLSFPLLFAAVPLYTIATHALPRQSMLQNYDVIDITRGGLQLNWFSDGGLSSNMPMHFFDSWLPTRPTFGINLTAFRSDEADIATLELETAAHVAPQHDDLNAVAQTLTDLEDYLRPRPAQHMAEAVTAGAQATADAQSAQSVGSAEQASTAAASHTKEKDAKAKEPDLGRRVFIPQADRAWQPEYHPISGMPAFIAGLFGTTQNNRDNAYMRTPGVRDRVVSIQLLPHEGGLNLGMKKEVIEQLSEIGRRAGAKLVEKFCADEQGFAEHRWVRARVLFPALARGLRQMHDSLGAEGIKDSAGLRGWGRHPARYFPAPEPESADVIGATAPAATGDAVHAAAAAVSAAEQAAQQAVRDWHEFTHGALSMTLTGLAPWERLVEIPDPWQPEPPAALKISLER